MPFPQYSKVRLRTDRFASQGVKAGDQGFIIEIYPDGAYEIEFSDSHGITVAQIVASDDDLDAADDQ